MSVSDLPALNATLNGLSFILLSLGVTFIKQGMNQNFHIVWLIWAIWN